MSSLNALSFVVSPAPLARPRLWRALWPLAIGALVLMTPGPQPLAQDTDAAAAAAPPGVESTLSDATTMLVNTPIYLSSRLSSLMGTRPLGAGMEVDALDELSFGFALRADINADFDEIINGTSPGSPIVIIPPDVLALPVISMYVRWGLIEDMDLGARVEFLPPVTVEYGPVVSEAGHIIAGMDLRYRVLDALGGIPEVLLSGGLSWFEGCMIVPSAYASLFDAGGGATGVFYYRGRPHVDWSLGQIQPEVRARWRVDWFHPYTALALDMTFGRITSSLDGEFEVEMAQIPGYAVEDAHTQARMDVEMVTERPMLASLRLVAGVEFDLFAGLHLVLQTDLSLPFHQQARRQGRLVEDLMGDATDTLYTRYRDEDLVMRPPVVSTALGLRYDFDFDLE